MVYCQKLIHNKIGWRFFGLLSDVYSWLKCVIRSGDKRTNFSSFDREVRKGCILSPLLFNVYNMYNIICLRNSQRVCDYIVRNNCNSFSSYQFVKQEVRLLYSLHLRRIKRRSSKSWQSLLDLLPCSNVIGYVCANECIVNKGTSSILEYTADYFRLSRHELNYTTE